MESKLEAYRLRKRRQQKYEQFKGILQRMVSFGTGARTDRDKEDHIIDVPANKLEDVSLEKDNQLSDILSSSDENEPSSAPESAIEDPNAAPPIDHHKEYINYTLKTCYFLFWATCFVIAIELQFGIVFLMFSALLGIYFNTRTGPKPKHEPSAYSVFNKNCESIDGTLKAEQFEREIRYGSSSVR
ncbi:SAYSvFN domain-containing protein 1 [Episyrphus balteatus]|uniref:SAYSvFN domain-containing protein 1 n=1 Tax=Episyrphus balteatus TaxID=286459 RepID=UPI002485CC31|nr:SAYSvFN domain-containing protein 1 [Episyrphus balteatus]